MLRAKVLVIGAGALGNEILKNLALLGAGRVFIADLDRIEYSNLSRSVLFRARDNGLSKAETAARAVQDIYPEGAVGWYEGDAIDGLGLGIYRWADVVLAGLDNRAARMAVNRACWKTNTPWIDGAIEQLNGVARVFRPPDGPCYECTMSAVDWELAQQRLSCTGLSREEMLQGRTPTTPTSASLIAAIQCQEAVKLLHGLESLAGRGYVYNGLTCESYLVDYVRNKDCLVHEEVCEVVELGAKAAETTLHELFAEARSRLGESPVLELNRQVIRELRCPACGAAEEVFKPVRAVPEGQAFCSACGMMRYAETFHLLTGEESFLDRTLAQAGVPPFDIITARNHVASVDFCLGGDAATVLGPLCEAG